MNHITIKDKGIADYLDIKLDFSESMPDLISLTVVDPHDYNNPDMIRKIYLNKVKLTVAKPNEFKLKFDFQHVAVGFNHCIGFLKKKDLKLLEMNVKTV